MSFDYSFSHLTSTSPTTMETHFLYAGANGLARPSLPSSSSLFTSIGRLLTYALSYFYLLLLSLSFWILRWPGGTVEEWTRKVGRGVWGGWVGRKWEGFVDEILGGLFGAVGTCKNQDVGGLEVGLLLGESHPPSLDLPSFWTRAELIVGLFLTWFLRVHLPHPLHRPLHRTHLLFNHLSSSRQLSPSPEHSSLHVHYLPPTRRLLLDHLHLLHHLFL